MITLGLEIDCTSYRKLFVQSMKGHEKMIIDMTLDHDKMYLFSASVDMTARSWLPSAGDEVRVFEGGERTVICVYVKGNICKFSSRAEQWDKTCWPKTLKWHPVHHFWLTIALRNVYFEVHLSLKLSVFFLLEILLSSIRVMLIMYILCTQNATPFCCTVNTYTMCLKLAS